jgi:heptosyltransferase-2
VTEEEKVQAINLLKKSGINHTEKIICVHPGASGAYTIWPPGYFAEFINYIIDNNLARVVLCSNRYDDKVVEQICMASQHKLTVLNLESIRELAAVISFCKLSLVNNSGPRHISAAVGVKSLSIFQKYDDGEWRIYDEESHPVLEQRQNCRVCFNNKCESIIKEGGDFGSECMWAVTPQQVISKIRDIL